MTQNTLKLMTTRPFKLAVTALVLLGVVIGTYRFFEYRKLYPSTDDAYVQGHTVNVASQISGIVQTVDVKNHQAVKKGQLLITIDPKPFQIALAQANAQLKTAIQNTQVLETDIKATKALVAQRKAQLVNTQQSYQRVMTLVKQHAFSQAQKDQSITNLKVAQAALAAAKQQYAEAQQKLGEPGQENANIKAAQAAVNSAQLNLQHTRITAPTDGSLANFTLRPGDALAALQSQFAIVANAQGWISANFKETQLQRIRPHQSVSITLDMYPGVTFSGQVMSISPGSGTSFSLLPPENATGNWVKVTQRVPVWISITKQTAYPLRLGTSANVTINTASLTLP